MIVQSTAVSIVTPPGPILHKRPSHFLSSQLYLNLAVRAIRGVLRVEVESTNKEDEIRAADNLGRVLKYRLERHIKTKVLDHTKHNHPALLFVRVNLNRYVALLCFSRQARQSSVMNHNSCLLQQPSGSGFLPALDEELEGSYLHYSNDEGAWVRSGKAIGSDMLSPINGIVCRNKMGNSKKAATASLVDGECFYTMYPSRSNSNQLSNRMGYFDDLTQYCGFSFKKSEDVEALISTVDGKCLFDWSLYINQLKTANIHGCKTLREKQLFVVGYFFEMCYDICLFLRHNVSNNQGLETILGVFDSCRTA